MSATTKPFSTQVTVSLGERGYPIVIQPGLLGEVGTRLKELGAKGKVGVVTDRTVARLYARQVMAALQREGYRVHVVTVPSGERAKTLALPSRQYDSAERTAGAEIEPVKRENFFSSVL